MTADTIILFQKFLCVLSIGVALIVLALAVVVLIDKLRNKPVDVEEEGSSDDNDVAHEARTLPHTE